MITSTVRAENNSGNMVITYTPTPTAIGTYDLFVTLSYYNDEQVLLNLESNGKADCHDNECNFNVVFNNVGNAINEIRVSDHFVLKDEGQINRRAAITTYFTAGHIYEYNLDEELRLN